MAMKHDAPTPAPSVQELESRFHERLGLPASRTFSLAEAHVVLAEFGAKLRDRLARLAFAPHGLSKVQFNVLRILVDHADDGCVRQKDVEGWLATSSANLSTVVDRMVPELVERVENPRDRRSKHLSITARGRAVLQAAEGHYDELLDAIAQQLDEADVRAAYELELRIQHAMERVLVDAVAARARSAEETSS